ncbi:CAAX geranylgeranyltransferase alpha subunit [Coemansia sp. RSA 1199]|nr:CAAX geranylgeranyltransferase alpha subunit [Coemansia sp. RSA 1199]
MRIEDSEQVEEAVPLAQQAKWQDITPIEQDEGEGSMCPIAYTDEYRELMGYLRAVMAVGEVSERALALTARVIKENPGHYTVWVYRKRLVEELESDIAKELDWVSEISSKFPKNYQLWHHRESLVTRLWAPSNAQSVSEDQRVTNPVLRRELQFLGAAIDEDSKNFHAWSYRQWLVSTYALWTQELVFVDTMINQDVRNNSAWNQRYFAILANRDPSAVHLEADMAKSEIEYVVEHIKLAPNNDSPWSYVTGLLLRHAPSMLYTDLLPRIKQLAADNAYQAAMTLTPFYWSALLDIYEQQAADHPDTKKQLVEESRAICDQLASETDIIHCRYWNFRKTSLDTC